MNVNYYISMQSVKEAIIKQINGEIDLADNSKRKPDFTDLEKFLGKDFEFPTKRVKNLHLKENIYHDYIINIYKYIINDFRELTYDIIDKAINRQFFEIQKQTNKLREMITNLNCLLGTNFTKSEEDIRLISNINILYGRCAL